MKKLFVVAYLLCFCIVFVRWFNTSPVALTLSGTLRIDEGFNFIFELFREPNPDSQLDIALAVEVLVSLILGMLLWVLGEMVWRLFARARSS